MVWSVKTLSLSIVGDQLSRRSSNSLLFADIDHGVQITEHEVDVLVAGHPRCRRELVAVIAMRSISIEMHIRFGQEGLGSKPEANNGWQ